MATEEERAAEFRRTQAARAAFVAQSERRLAGSPSARVAFLNRWAPWLRPVPIVAEVPDSDRTNAG